MPYYYSGCKMYDILAGSKNMESSYLLGKGKALEAFPMLKAPGLCGAVVYYDGELSSTSRHISILLRRGITGQHNDSRMNMALIMTAVQHGAVVANHVEVVELIKDEQGQVRSTKMRDVLTGEEWLVKAKVRCSFLRGYSTLLLATCYADIRYDIPGSYQCHRPFY
jgi:glycerol-3-phosphate dehydrogenase